MHNREHQPVLAITFMLFSTLFFSLSDGLGKWLMALYPIPQVAFIRTLVGIVILLLVMITTAKLHRLKTERPIAHIFRGILSASIVFLMYYGLKTIPLAEFVSLCFGIPFFIAIISPWYLNEKVSRDSWIAIVAGFIGILIILRPTPDHISLGHVATVFLAFVVAVMVVTAREMGSTENFYSLNFYLYPFGLLMFGSWSTTVWIPPTAFDWFLLVSLGMSTTIALACYIQATHLARPALVAPIDYIRIIWTILMGYYIWQEVPDTWTWIGMAVIILSGIYVVRTRGTVPEVDAPQGLVDEDE